MAAKENRQLVAVLASPGGAVLSVVSAAYYAKLLERRPAFYDRYQYKEFESPLSLTQLTALLPFRLDAGGGVERVAMSSLAEAESEFVEGHRDLMAMYWRHGLKPEPAWELFPMDLERLSKLSDVRDRLAEFLKPEMECT